ncbi:MAG: hypothetical protein ACFB0B_19565 [Thermonemataceae bacterium]
MIFWLTFYLKVISGSTTPESMVASEKMFLGFLGDTAYCYLSKVDQQPGSYYQYTERLIFYARKFDGTLLKKEKVREVEYKSDVELNTWKQTELVKKPFDVTGYLIKHQVAMRPPIPYETLTGLVPLKEGLMLKNQLIIEASQIDRHLDLHMEHMFAAEGERIYPIKYDEFIAYESTADYNDNPVAKNTRGLKAIYFKGDYLVLKVHYSDIDLLLPVKMKVVQRILEKK